MYFLFFAVLFRGEVGLGLGLGVEVGSLGRDFGGGACDAVLPTFSTVVV
jgi:hypothetical protein